ncbi:HEAT repeat domain-containing protein [Desulfonatronospira sp.]|uniref:HEAT repeat domain-containing protein n=1 Tax=Desulfonatronospira sp. TaxID=1962951 RepID=UPI0025BA393A|nr:HEAT repeat domain-containing protein [Desulfonatronospira sp.]
MSDFDPRHLVTELEDNVKKQDLIKAKLVLEHIDGVDLKTQKKLLHILEHGKPDFAGPLLVSLISQNADPAGQLPELKGALMAVALRHPGILLKTIEDKVAPREVFISMAGELRMQEAATGLMEILVREMDEDILKEAVTALGSIGDPSATNAISEFLYSNHKSLIIAATRSLGQIGTPTAMQRLSEKMGSDPQLDILILDIFSQVQDHVSLNRLNQSLCSHYAHLRNYAKSKLVRIGPKAVPMLCDNLLHDDPDLLIHTLNVLGDIGDSSALTFIRKMLGKEPRDPNVRFAAYEALGRMPLDKGAYILARGLTDPEEHVCVVAASAIDQNLNQVLAAGVKNMVRQRDQDAIKTVRAIISAQAKNLLIAVLEEEAFQEMAVDYLLQCTAPDVRDNYRALLQKYGYMDLARKLQIQESRDEIRPLALAVDDSKMILKIYKSTLYELGFEPVLFEYPAEALEWLQKNKPEAVFTDLNMPEITGIEFIGRARELYPEQGLPIIMVTTQNEVQDNERARQAGVSDITFKPFTAESLKLALDGVRQTGRPST